MYKATKAKPAERLLWSSETGPSVYGGDSNDPLGLARLGALRLSPGRLPPLAQHTEAEEWFISRKAGRWWPLPLAVMSFLLAAAGVVLPTHHELRLLDYVSHYPCALR